MGTSAWQGGVVAGYATPENSDAGGVFSGLGFALMDLRQPYTYQPGGNSPVSGFLIGQDVLVIDAVPAALAAANIAAAQVPTVGTPLVLTAGAGVTAAPNVPNLATGLSYSSTLVLDGLPAGVNQNPQGSFKVWNPATLLSRNVRITSAGNDSGATFLVAGLDVYGFPMSERITGANAGVASGRKAFKYILSVVAAGAVSGSNVSVGTGDVYGFPLLANGFSIYSTIFWNGALISSATGFTLPDVTAPATPLTGDVRGTYAVQSASDGTKRLQIIITPGASNVGSSAGLYGQAQA